MVPLKNGKDLLIYIRSDVECKEMTDGYAFVESLPKVMRIFVHVQNPVLDLREQHTT